MHIGQKKTKEERILNFDLEFLVLMVVIPIIVTLIPSYYLSVYEEKKQIKQDKKVNLQNRFKIIYPKICVLIDDLDYLESLCSRWDKDQTQIDFILSNVQQNIQWVKRVYSDILKEGLGIDLESMNKKLSEQMRNLCFETNINFNNNNQNDLLNCIELVTGVQNILLDFFN